MQLRSKWGALALVILMLGSVGSAGLVLARSGSSAPAAQTNASSSIPTIQTAPLNPSYVRYLQEKATGTVQTQTPDGHGLGYVPPPDELSKLPTVPSPAAAETFPTRYDLRTLGKVSPLGDQGSCGCCWAFATFGSLESYLLPRLTTTYSENNLKNLHDFDNTCCEGGNSVMSTAYLARWGIKMTDVNGAPIAAGPVTSAFDPYNNASCGGSPTTSQTAMHVQNVFFLPVMTSGTDTSEIKAALQTWGGVYTTMYWEGSTHVQTPYYNPAPAAYYENDNTTTNHAVTIVGWNDSFPATSFSTTPPRPGAWIVKNSWGTDWGQQGFFYISYYDAAAGKSENTVFTAEPTTNYKTNYQYNPFGTENQTGSGTSGYGANVFTANSTGTLKAISFWALSEDTEYTAQVYVNPTNSSNPTSGTLMSTISGTASNAGYSYLGYYTENLTTTVPLTNGERFAVVVKFTTPGNDQPVPVQSRMPGIDDKVPNAIAGQSFYSPDGTTWTDLATQSYVADIHAFE